jgi:hypothetical protein
VSITSISEGITHSNVRGNNSYDGDLRSNKDSVKKDNISTTTSKAVQEQY